MLNLPEEHYDKYPHAYRALLFLKGAQEAFEPTNRYIGFWIISFYLLSHSIELSIKAVIKLRLDEDVGGHDIADLAERYNHVCNFSEDELRTIGEFNDLNNGPGGLRYDNDAQVNFFPFTFRDGVKIVERLFKENFQ